MHTHIPIIAVYHYLHFYSWNIICGCEKFRNVCTMCRHSGLQKMEEKLGPTCVCLDSSRSVSFKRGWLKCPSSKAERITLCFWEKGHKCYYLNSLIMTLSWGHHISFPVSNFDFPLPVLPYCKLLSFQITAIFPLI